MIGCPASGMQPGTGHDNGAWRRLEISPDDEGWQLVLRERRATLEGAVTDGPHLSFRLPRALPGARVARFAAKP